MTKSKAAFLFASQTLGKQPLYLWTFTFKELLAVKETRKRWNHLLTLCSAVAERARLAGVRAPSGWARLTRPSRYESVHRRQSRARVGSPGWLGSDSCEANAQRTFRVFSKVFVERTASVFVPMAIVGGIRERLGVDES